MTMITLEQSASSAKQLLERMNISGDTKMIEEKKENGDFSVNPKKVPSVYRDMVSEGESSCVVAEKACSSWLGAS